MKRSIFFPICLLFVFNISCFDLKAQDLDPGKWPNLVGYWKFQNSKDLTQATVGKNLSLNGTHAVVGGPAYGDTAVRIAIGSYYNCEHGIAPNGGGDSVNQYTLMFDFKILSLNRWHTLFQTDTTNRNDGECFIRPNTGSKPGRIGTATTAYTEDSILPNRWYRLVISVNLNHYYRYYINGKLWLEGDTQAVDERFALTPKILFFADNNQEDDTIDIASVAIFDTCLSAADIAKIGTIEPCIANPPKINLGSDTSLCSYNSLNLGAGINYVKYQWSTGKVTPFVLIESSALGIGQSAIWLNVIDKNGCSGSDTILINFVAPPKVKLDNDTSICDGVKISMDGGLDANHTYQWRIFPSGNFLSSNHAITVDSTGLYVLRKTSAFGCFKTDSIQVTVNKNPIKPTIIVNGTTTFCDGDSVELVGPNGFSNYLWSDNSTQAKVHASKSQVLTLQVKDANGCISPPSDTIEIFVFPLPQVPTLAVLGDTLFCEGDSTILSAPSGFVSYMWPDGLGMSTRTVKAKGSYSVSVTDTNSCASPFSNTIIISTLPSPEKQMIRINGKNIFCEGDSAKLSISEDFSNYSWSDGNKLKERIIVQTGAYRVKVQNNSGCESPWSDSMMIKVHSYPPKPVITIATNDTLVCNRNADHYRWFMGGNLLSDTSKTILAMKSAFYKVQAGNGNCWSELSDSFYYQKLSVKSYLGNSFSISAYPNPVSNKLTIYREKMGLAFLSIYDLQGKLCLSTNLVDKESVVDVSNMDAGIYTIQIREDNSFFAHKIMIAR